MDSLKKGMYEFYVLVFLYFTKFKVAKSKNEFLNLFNTNSRFNPIYEVLTKLIELEILEVAEYKTEFGRKTPLYFVSKKRIDNYLKKNKLYEFIVYRTRLDDLKNPKIYLPEPQKVIDIGHLK